MSRGRILVVDDEAGMRDMLAAQLIQEDFDVVTADGGEAAVLLAKDQKYDVVITDLKMSGMDGVETLMALKQLQPSVEVIVATGYATVETAIACMKLGAYDYIQKPFHLTELSMQIDRALEKSHLQGMLVLYEASNALLATQDRDILIRLASELSHRVLLTDASAIVLLREGADPELHLAAEEHQPSGPLLVALARRALEAGVGLRLPFPKVHDVPLAPQDEVFNSAFVYPLIVRGRPLGALILLRSEALPPFNTYEFQRGSVFAAQVAQALHTAEVLEDLDRRAKTMQTERDAALHQAQGQQQRTAHLATSNQAMEDSQRKLHETQGQLLRATNMASMGSLMGSLSHGLNNPIGVILGFAQILLKRMPPDDPLRMPVASIERESQRCAQMVRSMLDFTRQTRKARERISATTLVQRLADLADAQAEHRGVRLEVDPSCAALPDVIVNPIEIEAALLNLVRNAMQATPAGGTVRLQARLAEQNGASGVELAIVDAGTGIPADVMPRLFEPFFDSAVAGQPPPAGMGLSLARAILDSHGGTLRVADTSDAGTTVCMWLPADLAGKASREQA